MLHSVDDDWLMKIASKKIVPPSEIVAAISSFKAVLAEGKNAAVLLGNFAQQHPQAAQIHAAAQALGVKVGFLGEAANSVGGYVAGLPTASVDAILQKKALVLLNAEPELDCADPQAALAAMRRAQFVISLSAYKTGLDYAHVLLPIAPFTETAGSFVSTEGRVQSFHATVHPLGEARPAWKVLRVLGTLLGKPGFELDTVEQVKAAALGGREVSKLLSNQISLDGKAGQEKPQGLQRIADVPIYFADPLVRRAAPLQKTRDARPPKAWMNAKLAARLGVTARDEVLVKQSAGQARLGVGVDDKLPDDCVRVAAAHASTAALGPMFGTVTVERAA
jgi:NADH-quinone oxidoreductase subunit G